MKISIIGPGFQINVLEMDSDESEEIILKRITNKYLELIKKGEPFILTAAENEAFTIYYPRPGDHFIIMSERQWRNIQREQMFAMQQHGRRQ